MISFVKNVDIRWSDLDPNFHLRHSVYYDFGASSRIDFLQQHGITTQFMQVQQFGPIIFREECVFKKEILLNDTVSVNLTLLKARPDYSRWTIQHNIVKNGDILSAILTIDGAWIDTAKRKLTVPPKEAQDSFISMPKGEAFEWLTQS